MRQASRAVVAAVTALLLVAQTSLASGVGDASWTPSQSSTTSRDSRFLIPGDAVWPKDGLVETTQTWFDEIVALILSNPEEWNFSLDKHWSRAVRAKDIG